MSKNDTRDWEIGEDAALPKYSLTAGQGVFILVTLRVFTSAVNFE